MATVLLVEPNDHLRTVFRRFFARAGFRLVEAVDGEAALGAAHRGRPDLIVVEGSVQDASGRRLPVRLADEPDLRRVPVIVLVGQPRGDGEGVERPQPSVADADAPPRLQELRHPFRPGRLIALAQGTLDPDLGGSAPPT